MMRSVSFLIDRFFIFSRHAAFTKHADYIRDKKSRELNKIFFDKMRISGILNRIYNRNVTHEKKYEQIKT